MTLSRRNVIIGGVAATWLVLLVLTFLLVRSSQEQSQRKTIQQIAPSVTQTNRVATEAEKQNLLFNRSEQEDAQRDFNEKIGKSSTLIKKPAGFTFELAPSLKQSVTPTPEGLKRVLAVATTCNIDSAPQSVFVYDLKSHWAVEDAAALAVEYGVKSPSYSLPTDSSTFQYQFTSADNSSLFSLYEASGKYRYHHAGTATGTPLNEGAMKDKSNAFIIQHRLNDKISPPSTTSLGETSLFTYQRVLDDFVLTDSEGVQSTMGQSICDVSDTKDMGQIVVEVRKDGSIADLQNNTRTIQGSYKVDRISLEAALIEYGASQPVDPIIFPPTATVDVSKLTIQSAVLAYYDVGANFGQTLYLPVYIGYGEAGGAQVIAFFPAVSATELLKKGLVSTVPVPGDASSQQQGTLRFASPTPHIPPPPPASGPIGSLPGGGFMLGCPGNLVDYTIICGVAGRQVCAGKFESPSSNDPLNACSSGCKEVSGTVTYQSGVSPCDDFLQQKNLPASRRRFRGPITNPGGDKLISPGDQVSCSVSACPC